MPPSAPWRITQAPTVCKAGCAAKVWVVFLQPSADRQAVRPLHVLATPCGRETAWQRLTDRRNSETQERVVSQVAGGFGALDEL